jgi:hypothetical protein
MAVQPAAVQLTVVTDVPTQKEIENTLDTSKTLSDAVAEVKEKLADIDTELRRNLSKDLTTAPLNVDGAVEKLKAAKSKREALELRGKACADLSAIVDARIQELKKVLPEALRGVVQTRITLLETQVENEKAREHLRREQINSLKALLKDIEKPESSKSR